MWIDIFDLSTSTKMFLYFTKIYVSSTNKPASCYTVTPHIVSTRFR